MTIKSVIVEVTCKFFSWINHLAESLRLLCLAWCCLVSLFLILCCGTSSRFFCLVFCFYIDWFIDHNCVFYMYQSYFDYMNDYCIFYFFIHRRFHFVNTITIYNFSWAFIFKIVSFINKSFCLGNSFSRANHSINSEKIIIFDLFVFHNIHIYIDWRMYCLSVAVTK